MFLQKYKKESILLLKILIALVAFLLGFHLLFFAFQCGILFTSFILSIEYFARNDGIIFCRLLQALLLISLIREYITSNKVKQGPKDRFTWKRKKRGTPLHFAKRCVLMIAIYCLGGLAAPVAIECVANSYRIILIILSKLWIVAVVILVVKIIFHLIRYARAVKKRKVFFKKLSALCNQKNVTFEQNGGIFPLEKRHKNDADFSIVQDGVRYECKFIYSLKRGDKMSLTDKGGGSNIYDYRLGQVHLFRKITTFRYDFEGSAQKLLIILPVPKTVIHAEGGRHLEIGDKVGEYTVYTATAFLNALERECLHYF